MLAPLKEPKKRCVLEVGRKMNEQRIECKMSQEKTCNKCGSKDFGFWTSTSTGEIYHYCRNCRRNRAAIYTRRLKRNGGHHTRKEWLLKLATYDKCPVCQKLWQDIPARPSRRYKSVWTKDQIQPITLGGTDDIKNIQPLCYRCNSAKCNRLRRAAQLTKRAGKVHQAHGTLPQRA